VLPYQREARLAFVMRWQQFTGPIVAKGLEDTALYVYHPLLSLNEVGGDPRPSAAASREDFFEFLQARQQNWPGTLDASSTHDTKRSEDVRARLNVLSEIPAEWRAHVERWSGLNAPHKQKLDGHFAPDRNEEYFLYQTMLGVWPLDNAARGTLLQRLQDHLIKATREAMVHTRWTRPNEQHENALKKFAEQILAADNREFLDDFGQFGKRLAYLGFINGLSQALVKIAAPGVADFYQGSELWDLRLVDPDNRGPIDFSKRMSLLEQIENAEKSEEGMQDLLLNWSDGRIKLYLTWKALCFRREHAGLFQQGELLPLKTAGCHAERVIAFLRRTDDSSVLVAVPRWLSKVGSKMETFSFDWCDTRVLLNRQTPQRWKNILEPGELSVSSRGEETCLMAQDLFQGFPVAFLEAA
jgi:(1->4)-alpha-D-glucan 1-alpha-D-glucosylmutase